MELLIRLERDQPPAGTVTRVREPDRPSPELPFVGWLGLLRVLAEAIGAAVEPADG